jgi:hypothetical protein
MGKISHKETILFHLFGGYVWSFGGVLILGCLSVMQFELKLKLVKQVSTT